MNDTVGFLYLGATIGGVVAAPIAIGYSLKTNRLYPGVAGGLMAVVAIVCSLPFRNTYEAPWLPGIVILFFSIGAVLVAYELLTRKGQDHGTKVNSALGIVARSLLAVSVFAYSVNVWIETVNGVEQKKIAAVAVLNAYRINLNLLDPITMMFDDLTLTDDELPDLISGLLDYPVDVEVIDLSRTGVTDDGIASLAAALPHLTVHR